MLTSLVVIPLVLFAQFSPVAQQAPARSTSMEPPTAVWLVELDGDGLPDKLFVAPDGTLSTAMNRGQGVFESQPSLELMVDEVRAILPSDLDDDGVTDLYLVSSGANVALRGDGVGGFRDATAALGLADAGPGLWAERRDVDGVAPEELVVHNADRDVVFWGRPGGFERDADAPEIVGGGADGAVAGAAAPVEVGGAGDASAGAGSAPTGGGTPGAGSGVLGGGGQLGDMTARPGDAGGLPAPDIAILPMLLDQLDARYVNDGDLEVEGSVDVVDGSLTGADIAFGSLNGNHVLDASLLGLDIEDSSITGADILDGSLTGGDVSTATGDVTHLGGSVGIGTTVPATTLDVSGSFRASGVLDSTYVLENTGSQPISMSHTGAGSPVAFDLREDGSGNNNLGDYGVLYLTRTNMNADGAGTALHFRARNVFGVEQEIGGIGATIEDGLSTSIGVSGGLNLYTTFNNIPRIPRIVIQPDGDVGIGTTAPLARLHVTGDTYIATRLGIGTSSPLSPLDVVGDATITGNVGIGTSLPIQKLSVVGDIRATDDVLAQFGSTIDASYRFGTGNESAGFSSPAFESLAVITSGTERMRVDSIGRVGIGTSFPVSTLHVPGTVTAGFLSKGGGTFKIDHPLDPENRYLSHSFVESPDMLNIYNGNVTLDEIGTATVAMPDWFEALNAEFRYQLTCVGGFAPVYVAEEMADGRFTIAGGAPGLKVSWQVTGVRQDAFANANRVQVEQDKVGLERGAYLHPEAFGLPESRSISAALGRAQEPRAVVDDVVRDVRVPEPLGEEPKSSGGAELQGASMR